MAVKETVRATAYTAKGRVPTDGITFKGDGWTFEISREEHFDGSGWGISVRIGGETLFLCDLGEVNVYVVPTCRHCGDTFASYGSRDEHEPTCLERGEA
jgi:hypothetical protein